MTYYLVSYVSIGMDNETGRTYVRSALFTRIKAMKEYIIELLKPIVRRQIISDHYQTKYSYKGLPDLSEDEIDDLTDAKMESIDLNGIINGIRYVFDLDTCDTISVVTLPLNTGQTKSVV